MESALHDVCVEYEWYNIPPLTRQDVEYEGVSPDALIPKDGIRSFKLLLSRINEPDPDAGQGEWRFYLKQETTLIDKNEVAWDNITIHTFDGTARRRFDSGGYPRKATTGLVTKQLLPINLMLTPVGFTVLRLGLDVDRIPLSLRLADKELAKLSPDSIVVGEFNTRWVSLLQEATKKPCILVYFSIDHCYTPVKYEFLNVGESQSRIAYVVEIGSLEQVGGDLWFPTSGTIAKPGTVRIDAFQTTGELRTNGQTDPNMFSIDFPPGTKVIDMIQDREYVVEAGSSD
jgi:hypothetical protein